MPLDRYQNAVKTESGALENFTIKLSGKPYRCSCGCNVFHKPDKTKLSIYTCNACGETFDSE